MNKKIFLMFVFGIMLISFVSATIESLPPVKQNDQVTLRQVVSNVTNCNLSSVTYPDSTQASGAVEMTKVGVEFTYNFTSTDQIGIYIVSGVCTDEIVQDTFTYDFDVTPSGKSLTDNGVFAGIALLTMFCFSILSFVLAFKIEIEGFKIFLLLFGYILLFATVALAEMFLQSTMLEGATQVMETLLIVLSVLFFAIFAYVGINLIVEALENIKKKRGLSM